MGEIEGICVLVPITLFCIYYVIHLRRLYNEPIYDPFGWFNIMKTELHCDSCNMKIIRNWKHGDYVNNVSTEKCKCLCKKVKCKGPMVITGIWFEKPKTREEIKSDKLDAKWR